MIKVLELISAEHPVLRLRFSNGSVGEVDLSPMIARDTAMTAPLADPDYFARVFLEAGAPTWPNGFDLAPWALHADLAAAGALQTAEDAA
ncbi:MAG: DUF2442 domain-containing protein [Pseudomonadota bacterium]